ncbi:MAG TPA: DUF1573 domain-containing protein [Chitinophagales bacterium]
MKNLKLTIVGFTLSITSLFFVTINLYKKVGALEKQNLEQEKAISELQETTSPFNQTPQQFTEPTEDAFGAITTISFDKKEHDFGTIKTGEVYSTTFYITNTGNEDLIISKAIGSCGCTVPEWDKQPIKKGEKTALKVNFDTKGKEGEQLKTVTITTNTKPSQTIFTIKAKVIL